MMNLVLRARPPRVELSTPSTRVKGGNITSVEQKVHSFFYKKFFGGVETNSDLDMGDSNFLILQLPD